MSFKYSFMNCLIKQVQSRDILYKLNKKMKISFI